MPVADSILPTQYHALSLANQAGYDVDLVGFSGSNPCEEVMNHPNIRLRLMDELKIPRLFNLVFFTRAIYKTIVQLWILFSLLLFTIPRPEYILCQNPPAIPLLAVALIVSIFRRTKFVVDWHNYGYTWLAVNRPGSSFLVLLYRIYEKVFGKLADANLCVSHAMQNDLASNWHIQANVLHDRPQTFFKRASSTESADLFSRHAWGKTETGENAFYTATGALKADRPALLVSSTSWTADEDFSVLLDAVAMCDARVTQESVTFPYVRFVVTGKGDLLEFYKKKIAALQLTHFTFYTEYLSFQDYARLLGSADLGVSLHFSSSKLDLPMKVVDMFGSELPVAAYDYGCLDELVQSGKNGFTFTTSEQLAQILFDILSKFPKDLNTLEKMRLEIKEFKKIKWNETWEHAALPIFGQPVTPPTKTTTESRSPTQEKQSSKTIHPKSPKGAATRQRISSRNNSPN